MLNIFYVVQRRLNQEILTKSNIATGNRFYKENIYADPIHKQPYDSQKIH
ncbi:hypothetical protein MNBD_GAMMA25-2315 [hydrothermal vent metagenome]|uniref:Uncharacterized protein n=1 Tax=hydrothermal vent metagenome TaxID=652676 RepID=A0A3B1BR95_9ZZZZ